MIYRIKAGDIIYPAILGLVAAVLFVHGLWWTRELEHAKQTIIPVSPQSVLDLLNTHGYSNCFLHADSGTNCVFLGGTNAAMFEVERK